ncbi:hypothetical protein [Nocardia mangyaensis]|uniref:hypothetical protein n=1 Tax=Nocardia mangyaensis TaxID=2213200 RepID=UPI0026775619|nr:hypothetical protein [Nocardia mangyaensis]MDO3647505.1 hypothetical protein [Nocardia mangyaensis]
MSVALAEELHRLEDQGSTGVLRTGDGEFHLVRGAIASAGCRRTIGLDRLVVEAGVATAEDWRRAGAGDPGPLLHRPRLETLALLSVFDAAYFLLASPGEPEFRPAPEHWLSPVCRVAPRAVVHECARRGDREWGPWPADLVAAVPVVPARRVRRNRVVLTGNQAEVLAAADTRRSVAEIARDLGRTTYGCLVAVRDLTAAGLIEAPEPIETVAVTETVGAIETVPVPRTGRHLALAPEPVEGPVRQRHSAPEPPAVPVLPKRIPAGGAGVICPPRVGGHGRHAVDEEATAAVRPCGNPAVATPYEPERWQQVDREVLIRLRAALEELE